MYCKQHINRNWKNIVTFLRFLFLTMQKAVKATVNTNSPYLHKYIFIYL